MAAFMGRKSGRPPHAVAARKMSNASKAGCVAMLAILIAATLHTFAAPKPSDAAALMVATHALMGATVEGDGIVGASAPCTAVSRFWAGLSEPGPLSCAEFLSKHWEVAPRLTWAGSSFAKGLMDLDDIRKMVGSFEFKIQKNHGTVVLQKPNSGFLADERWRRGDPVPSDVADVAMREGRTLVIHNIEVYWPPVTALARQLVRFFHTYTQVNLYMSPGGISVATAPHQDAHSVFIVQLHGAKRWCVHPPAATRASPALALKWQQRGKQGEVLDPDDRTLMGPPLINTTLRPGSVLYVPRAFYHHTATSAAKLAAPAVVNGAEAPGDEQGGGGEGELPSVALTFSVLSEDVHCTWLSLLGEGCATSTPWRACIHTGT